MKLSQPCNICIVQSCCTIYCNEYFEFANKIIDLLPKMSGEQRNKFRKSNPHNMRSLLNEMSEDDRHFIVSYKLKYYRRR